MTKTLSKNGLHFLKNWEGLRLEAYHLPGEKYWTIGYGHNGPDVHAGMKITEARATELLLADVRSKETSVNNLVDVPLNQNQFDALVDFTYNLGAGNLKSSTLLRMLNASKYSAVPTQLMKWVLDARKKPSAGLRRRRAAECELWGAPK